MPGKSTCPCPARGSPTPEREAKTPMGHPSPCCRPGEAFQPMLASFQQLPQQMCPAWHPHVPVSHEAGSAMPPFLAKGSKGCPGSCWCGGRLGDRGQQGQGWPAGGQASCQHWWRNARISQEGDPGRMIYWDFIAVSVSSQLICTHKISSCWFSGDPCSQIRVPAPSLALDWLGGSTVHLGYPAREAGTQPHIGVSTCASQVRASPPWLGHAGKG